MQQRISNSEHMKQYSMDAGDVQTLSWHGAASEENDFRQTEVASQEWSLQAALSENCRHLALISNLTRHCLTAHLWDQNKC